MKNKKKIFKIRPFNMANFSGGSGYLVFSLIYQAFALIPGALIVWLLTLIKLPKDDEGNIIPEKAKKRFLAVAIPFTVIFIIGATILAIHCCYGDLKFYSPLIIFIGIVPAVCTFFIIKFFYDLTNENKASHDKVSRGVSIVFSIVSILVALAIVFGISIAVNSILENYEYERDNARFEAEMAELDDSYDFEYDDGSYDFEDYGDEADSSDYENDN